MRNHLSRFAFFLVARGCEVREGHPRPVPAVVVDEDAEPVDRLRLFSAWSAAALVLIAAGAVLFVMRETFLPIATAFLAGVKRLPVAEAPEERGLPRIVSAGLIVLATALVLVVASIAAPLTELAGKLPEIGSRLHSFEGALGVCRRLETSVGIEPEGSRPSLPPRSSTRSDAP